MARPHPLRLLGVSLLLALAMLWGQGCSLLFPPPPPTVGTPVVQPSTLPVNQATLLTVASRITSNANHPVVPASVKLERVDAQGTIVANLGTMYDDGTHGDAVAGDGIFTVQVSLTESTPGMLRLQVAATFRAGPGRITSDIALVPIVTPTNTPPVANAGPNQTVSVGATVQLDGRQSSDVDGDPLTFRWAITSPPAGSLATLSDPTAVQPTFVVDKPGTYAVQLIVNDGTVESAPASVLVRTKNLPPVATAGPDQTVAAGTTVQLDGRQSSDADGDPLTLRWALTVRPAQSAATLSDVTAVQPTFVVDQAGTYVAQLIVNDGQVDSAPATTTITAAMPPQVHLDPADGALLNTATPLLTITYQDAESGIDLASLQVLLDGIEVTARFTITPTQATYGATLADGGHQLAVTLRNLAGLSTQVTAQFTIDTLPPPPIAPASLTVGPMTNGQVAITGASGSTEGGALVTLVNTRTGQQVQGRATAVGGFTAVLAAQPGDGVRLTSTDAAGNTSAAVTVPIGVPPDPALVAPPLDRSVATTMATATAFLYTGTNPIQTGVAPGTIEPRRAAVIRGRVLSRDGQPLAGVRLTVLQHAELGQTFSRADGMFDLAVNGGGFLTITYEQNGYLAAQRQINVPWQDFVWLPDVSLIPVDTQVVTVDLTKPDPIQVVRGSPVTDYIGSRQATLLFPAGTAATLVKADGTTQALSTLHVRATEYTVGPNGPSAMPAELPPTSGYTYCVELSADEALAAGARTVQFSQPVINYLENYLNARVGSIVPVGYYDRGQGVWVPSDNGRVIQILTITPAGLAEVDTDGDGVADNGLGLTDAERQRLAALYPVGQTLWRVPISHFSPWDYNWPFGPPADATPPNQPVPWDETVDDQCQQPGSSIGCQNQTVGEAIEIVGTPFRLHYQSDRSPGRKAAYSLDIPLSGDTVPASLIAIELEVSIAGRLFTHTVDSGTQCPPPALVAVGVRSSRAASAQSAGLTNQHYTFLWDSKDAYGRTLQGRQPVTVRIGYSYCGVYMNPRQGGNSFGALSGVLITGSSTPRAITLWQEWNGGIGPWDARGQGLGGWTLHVHHAYDLTGLVYQGDGQRRAATSISNVITTIAGTGVAGYSGDGGPATAASLSAYGVAVGPDGSLYIADAGSLRIRRVGPDGLITTVAGGGNPPDRLGDGGPATAAFLNGPEDVAVGPDGSLYIADMQNTRIRRVGPDGLITTMAGTGVAGYSGDGGPATAARLHEPWGIAVGPDGSLYIADSSNTRIRRVGPDGLITTVAGTGAPGYSGDGGPATAARLNVPRGVAVGPDGSLYIADTYNSRIRRVGPDGLITTITGTGVAGYSGDGGPATAARLHVPWGVTVGPDGSLYIADGDRSIASVRRVGPDGIITTVAGTGVAGYSGDGGLATAARLFAVRVVVGPDGSLYIADAGNARIRRVQPRFAGLGLTADVILPAEDGSEVYVFNSAGRHLRTLHSLTGAMLYQFGYDAEGRLTTLTDGDGNTTTIERDADGKPTAMVAPFGRRTTLSLNANGFLASLANPAGDTSQFRYTDEGLLTSLTDPRGFIHTFTYDSLGFLTKDADPAGGFTALARTEAGRSFTVSRSTALDRTTTYQTDNQTTGNARSVNTFPDGTQTELLIGTAGSRKTTLADGTVLTLLQGPDPRFSMQAPLDKQLSITMGGVTSTLTTERTANLADPNNLLSLTTQTDTITVNGRIFTSSFNAATRTFTTTTPMGRQGTTKIDPLGRIIEDQPPGLDAIQYSYDAQGRLSGMHQGAGEEARDFTFQYTPEGYLGSITDPLSNVLRFEYDHAGRVTKEILQDGKEIALSYDSAGNVTSVTPPGKPTHAFQYNAVDLMLEYDPPDVGVETDATQYTYNGERQITQILRPDGQTIALSYDTGGRLSALTFPNSSVTYTYDPAKGYLTSIHWLGGNSLSYAYDGLLTTNETYGGDVSGSVSWSYDNSFRVTEISINGGNTIGYQYDKDGLITKAGDLTLSRSAQNGFLTATTLGNVSDAWTYNSFGEPASYVAKYNTTEIFKQQFTYDQLGRMTEKTETIDGVTDTYTYLYDTVGRLNTIKRNNVTTTIYVYDSNGNRLSHTGPGGTVNSTYDNQDRLLQYGITTYSYTSNGELKSKTTGTEMTQYGYDAFGDLKSVTLPNGDLIEYAVDGIGRRTGKKLNGAWDQKFLSLNQLKPIAELDASNTIVSRFVYGSQTIVPDYMVKGGITYRIISDQLGSPRIVIDTTTGAVVQRMDYDEFGNVINDTNPGLQPFGFAGGLYDPHTVLVRFGARDYEAVTGRWTAKDPSRFSSGSNLYSYANNDPVNLIDPLGNKPEGTIVQRPGDIRGRNPVPRGMKITPEGQFPTNTTSGEINTPTPARPPGVVVRIGPKSYVIGPRSLHCGGVGFGLFSLIWDSPLGEAFRQGLTEAPNVAPWWQWKVGNIPP